MANLFPTKGPERAYLLLGLRIVGDFGATIAIPVVLLVYIGQRIDDSYGTGPFTTIGAFIISALISGFMIYKKAKMYGRLYTDIEKEIPPEEPKP